MNRTIHENNTSLDLIVFNPTELIKAFRNECDGVFNDYDVNLSTNNDDLALKAAIKWYKFKQTDIFKREILIPSTFAILLLGTLTAFYYYTLCTDKSWMHLAEMVIPALLALFLGIFGTLSCIRGYAYADYHFAKQKLS